ncbi:MAG: insulinase family protein [Chloroflexi bacterium]|nr:insulinase family protein [Chloroflexota bacterium]
MSKHNSSKMHFPGPHNITRFRLANGITVLAFSNMSSKSLIISGMLSSGGIWDPPGKYGTAHFTAAMLMRGNENNSFQEINDQLEGVGASLSFSASTRNTYFRGRSLVKDFPLLLALIRDSLTRPTFPEIYIKRLRNQLLTGLIIRDQDTQEKASLEYDRILFRDHPYGTPVDGYPDTIQAIQREDLVRHHQTYQPQDAILAISGALQEEEIKSVIQQFLGDWNTVDGISEPLFPALPPLTKTTRLHFPIDGKSQSDIQMGCYAPNRSSDDYYPAYVGNHVLGQFGLYGRIGRSVRNKEGLAYYAYSSINAFDDAGSWEFSAGVNPKNVEKTIALIINEIEHYLETPVSKEELEDSQSHLVGRLPMSLESNAGIANALLSIERFGLGLDYFQNYAKRIQAITPEQILEVSRCYLDPEKLVIISAGAKVK